MSIMGGLHACPRRGQPDGGADQQIGLRSGVTLARKENPSWFGRSSAP
jgi:hypothetical protein